jgi:hypothetical protein
VLPEAQLASGDQHATKLLQRGCRVGHGAEDSGEERAVKAPVGGGQCLGDAVHHLDRHSGPVGALGGEGAGGRIRLDREHRLHRGREELEGTTVAARHLDHAPAEPGEQPPSQLARDLVGPTLLAPLQVAREAGLLGAVERQRTTSETATNCAIAAATTSTWKTSWYPNVAGNGSGRRML